MTIKKERLTVTVDRALLRAGARAVAGRQAQSLSSWVNSALEAHVARARRLEALAAAVAGYEKEFGAITDAELVAQEHADRRTAVVVRGRVRPKPGTRRRSAR